MASPAFPLRGPKRTPKQPAYYPRRVARPADPRIPTRYPVRQPPARVPIRIPVLPPAVPPAAPLAPMVNPLLSRSAFLASRALPGVGWVLLGYSAYQWFTQKGAPQHDLSGWTHHCFKPAPPGIYQRRFQTSGIEAYKNYCGLGGQAGGQDHANPIPISSRSIAVGEFNGSRTQITDVYWRYSFGTEPQFPVPTYTPSPQPSFIPVAPPWMPWYLPIFQPVPFPLAPPYRDLPGRDPKRRRRRNPKPDLPELEISPVPDGPVIPSLDIDNGDRWAIPKPGLHERRKPEEKEKEKKTELKGSASKAWLDGMEKLISGITETDDFVSAVYKGLPWQLRRWKGRDGVWRDRDITTASRLSRLYGEIGSLNIKTAIKEVIKENAIDYAGAFLGKLNNKALKNNQYYRGKQGLQAGGRLNKDVWKKLKDDLALQAAKAQPDKYHYRWVKDKDGLYYRKRVLQQKQMIPWLQHVGTKTYRTKERPGNVRWWQTPVPQKDDVILAPEEWTYYVPYRKD